MSLLTQPAQKQSFPGSCWEQMELEAHGTLPSSTYSFTSPHNSSGSERKADILTVLYFTSCWERSGWE